MTMSLSFPESSAEISSAFIETLVLIHRNFYRNLTTPVPLNQFVTLMTLRLEKQATLSEVGHRLQIDPQQHRTFETSLRASVEAQTALKLGYIEQLYTFGDRGRQISEHLPRRIHPRAAVGVGQRGGDLRR